MSRHSAFCESVASIGLGILPAVVAGCGFGPGTGGTANDDAASKPADAGIADADGSNQATGCFPQWLDHTVKINPSTVAEITELSSGGDDRNPWISDDGLRIYFSREPREASTSDIHLATRMSTTQPFGQALPLMNLNSNEREARAFLTSDEQTLVLSTARNGPLDILMTTRMPPDPFDPPDDRYLTVVNMALNDCSDPSISADRLRLYMAANTVSQGRTQLLIATRSSITSDFSRPSQIPGTLDTVNSQADPTLYSDERLLLFSAFPVGSGSLWYATRSSATDSFGPAVQIPGVNDADTQEFDPVLSADGCELYFASTRRQNRFHLFRAQVTK